MCRDCQWFPEFNKKWIYLFHSPDIGGVYHVLFKELQIEGIAEFTIAGWQNFRLTKGIPNSSKIDLDQITHWMPINR